MGVVETGEGVPPTSVTGAGAIGAIGAIGTIGAVFWDMMTTFAGGAGVESMTLGRGSTREASPTPIRAKFESSNSRGQGWSV